MNENKTTKKFDVSSTAVEKSLDIAKNFVDKLVLPSTEELGLLLRDQISLWRFNNQIRILNKAKLICEKNDISVKAIPPKLLCPYLDNAALEDDDELQDKWANLLVNMVDSQQNIQNHVFPYILSQLSKDEFNLLDTALTEKKRRLIELENELSCYLRTKPEREGALKAKLDELDRKLEELSGNGKISLSQEAMKLRSTKSSTKSELWFLNYREQILKRQITAPQSLPEDIAKEFEVANIIRLGLAKVIYEASAGPHSIEIPAVDPDSFSASTSVDLDLEIETETSTMLTELGELFIEACYEKET